MAERGEKVWRSAALIALAAALAAWTPKPLPGELVKSAAAVAPDDEVGAATVMILGSWSRARAR